MFLFNIYKTVQNKLSFHFNLHHIHCCLFNRHKLSSNNISFLNFIFVKMKKHTFIFHYLIESFRSPPEQNGLTNIKYISFSLYLSLSTNVILSVRRFENNENDVLLNIHQKVRINTAHTCVFFFSLSNYVRKCGNFIIL